MKIDALYADCQRALGADTAVHGWTDWSAAAFDRRRGIVRDTLRRLDLLCAETRLDGQECLDAMLLARELRLDLESIDYRLHAFPVNQLMGVPNQTTDGLRIPFFLTTRHPLESIEDAQAIIELVVQSEGHLRQLAAALREGTSRGITPPQEAVRATKIVIHDSLRGIPVAAASEAHPIYRRFSSWASGATGASPGALRHAGERLAAALAGPFRRGYEAIDAALDEMLARGRTSFGVWDLPDGAAFYRHSLERWSGTAESADSLHRMGLAEIARLKDEIRPLLGDTDQNANLPDIADRLRGDVEACYPNTPAGAAAYIARAQSIAGMVFERLGRITTWRPRSGLDIRAVEPARQSGALYAEFYPATPDGRQPSLYTLNTGDMSRLPKSELAALTFHESVPGHHLQICTTQERTDLSLFRRRPFLYESYCEGWAMYSEQLGSELLADVLSPTERLGCLTRRLWMAARVAVDTGVHALRWSRADAIRFFRDNTFAPLPMIEQEVDRLSVWPAQATAYHVGYLAFSGLRDVCLGADRDSRSTTDFHDRLFQLGPVPAGMLKMAFGQYP